MTQISQSSSYIITLPPPTPNGGLHVGHLAGPFLAADVFAKGLMLDGHDPHVASFSDTHQSYVRATAQRQGVEPLALARHWSENIVETLGLYHCRLDHYFEPTQDSASFLQTFFLDLYEAGILKRKNKRFYYSSKDQTFLDEAGVAGFCPECLESCTCGICENCGALTSADNLVSARNATDPTDILETREIAVLVLEIEPLRKDIAAFHADNPFVRPKYAWLVEDILAGPLPDFPITVPGQWGLRLGHDDFEGQVLNAWPEIMANFLFAYERHIGKNQVDPVKIVNFFGFDNSCFYAIVHVALLISSHNERFLPLCTMTNEFYNLDQAKFSTSRDHAIWAYDLTSDYPVDFTRFFLALTAPGFEQGNFNVQEMRAVIEKRVVRPWNDLASRLNQSIGAAIPNATMRADQAGQILSKRFRKSIALERFNLRQAAEDALNVFEVCDVWLGKHHNASDVADVIALLQQWCVEVAVLMPRLAPALLTQITAFKNGTGPLPTDLNALSHDLNGATIKEDRSRQPNRPLEDG